MSATVKMILGGYTFAHNPHSMSDIFQEDIPNNVLITYSSYAYFSWPKTIVGKIVTLNWDYMTSSQYDSLYTKYAADAIIEFNPRQDITFKFNVIIKSLQGVYFLDVAASSSFRKDVKMELLIVSKV
jgi:hypothetical protein